MDQVPKTYFLDGCHDLRLRKSAHRIEVIAQCAWRKERVLWDYNDLGAEGSQLDCSDIDPIDVNVALEVFFSSFLSLSCSSCI